MLIYAIGAVMFGIVTLAAWQLLQPREDILQRRLIGNGPVANIASARNLEGSLPVRMVRPLQMKASRFLTGLLPQNAVKKIDRMLRMADTTMSLPAFLFVWCASALLGVGLFAFVVATVHLTMARSIFLALAVLPTPILGPYLFLSIRVRRRQKSIVKALPDSLDLLVTAVEAGMGVDSAIALVANRTQGPLADSFHGYINQVNLGRTRNAALRYMADTTGVKELNNLVINVTRGEELGMTIGDVLRRHAADLRIERKDRAREAAYRAPVLMTIPLVLCFLPAMGAVIVVPMALNLLDFISRLGR